MGWFDWLAHPQKSYADTDPKLLGRLDEIARGQQDIASALHSIRQELYAMRPKTEDEFAVCSAEPRGMANWLTEQISVFKPRAVKVGRKSRKKK